MLFRNSLQPNGVETMTTLYTSEPLGWSKHITLIFRGHVFMYILAAANPIKNMQTSQDCLLQAGEWQPLSDILKFKIYKHLSSISASLDTISVQLDTRDLKYFYSDISGQLNSCFIGKSVPRASYQTNFYDDIIHYNL